MLIHDWRIRWQQGYFPFLFVQLANYRERNPQPADDDWAELREAQAMARNLPYTGMASAIDIGEAMDIHPKNKEDVGKRLYLAAKRIAYGDASIIHEGPVFESMKIEGGSVRLRFSSIGSGLITRNNEALKGFSICGKDQKFYWAEGRIEGEEVVLKATAVVDPVAVRYNWASNPDGNLYNREGLPALSFRTDRFKGITE
jgi:sialate O-acetylesterase